MQPKLASLFYNCGGYWHWNIGTALLAQHSRPHMTTDTQRCSARLQQPPSFSKHAKKTKYNIFPPVTAVRRGGGEITMRDKRVKSMCTKYFTRKIHSTTLICIKQRV